MEAEVTHAHASERTRRRTALPLKRRFLLVNLVYADNTVAPIGRSANLPYNIETSPVASIRQRLLLRLCENALRISFKPLNKF